MKIKNGQPFNIAFEISPILAASGSFGDKSGVYRLNFNLIKYLSDYLIKNNLDHQIFLYTLSPSLTFNISTDVYNLIKRKNVHLIRSEYINGKLLQDYSFFDVSGIRFIVKRIDKYFFRKALEANIFFKYLKQLNLMLKKNNIMIIHHSETGFSMPSTNKSVKNVIHINDLVTDKYPFWQRAEAVDIHKRKLRFASKNCQGVFCISNSTKNDLITYLKKNDLPIPNTRVVYLAAEDFRRSKEANFTNINKHLEKLGYSKVIKDQYFLYFGTIEPRKNTTMLISVFNALKKLGKLNGFKLVIMGGKGWGKIYDKTANFIRENYPNKEKSPIIMLDFMSDEYLATVIENARGVVYPSFYEGFGLPVVESMNLGTPVITSNISSIPEVGGDACMYIDPNDPEEFSQALIRLASSKELRSELSKKSLMQAKKFSWEKVAKETLDFYIEILNRKN